MKEEASTEASSGTIERRPVLWAIDFDLTIVTQHVGNLMRERGRRLKTNEFLTNPPIGGAKRWKKIFLDFKARGDKIAIVTFGDYAKEIKLYLEKTIGLEKDFVKENIIIVAYYPTVKNKNEHIDKALEILKNEKKCVISETDVVLIDDDYENIDLWRRKRRASELNPDDGAILANADGGHLERIEALCQQLDQNPDLLRRTLIEKPNPILMGSMGANSTSSRSQSSEDEEEEPQSSEDDDSLPVFRPGYRAP